VSPWIEKIALKCSPKPNPKKQQEAQQDIDTRWQMYQYLAAFKKE